MRKILILGVALVLMVAFLGVDPAQAWHRHYYRPHGYYGFGLYYAPPPVYYPSYPYYGSYPSYGYNDYGYRARVPGYWGWRPYGGGWGRAWTPGYWR